MDPVTAYLLGILEGMVLGAGLALAADRLLISRVVRALNTLARRRHGGA